MKGSLLKLVIVSNARSGGGAERSMNTLANELLGKGFNVVQIFLNNSKRDTVPNLALVYEMNREWKDGNFRTFTKFLKFNSCLIRIKPDILMLNCELAELYGAFSFYSGITIAVEHTNKPWLNRKKLGRFVRLILRCRQTHWIKVSSHINVWPQEKKEATIIENPIMECKRRAIEDNRQIDNLVFIGRFTLQKQPNILVSIAKATNKKLLLFGEGELLNSVKKECVENQIDFLSYGFVANPWSLVPPNSLLIIPSKFEGDGMVVVEAVLANLPFLISDIPEFRRFNFPEENYCSSIEGYISSIINFEKRLNNIEIPTLTSTRLATDRDPIRISNDWIHLLKNCYKNK